MNNRWSFPTLSFPQAIRLEEETSTLLPRFSFIILAIRVRSTGNCVFNWRVLSPVRKTREWVKWKDNFPVFFPYFELYWSTIEQGEMKRRKWRVILPHRVAEICWDFCRSDIPLLLLRNRWNSWEYWGVGKDLTRYEMFSSTENYRTNEDLIRNNE